MKKRLFTMLLLLCLLLIALTVAVSASTFNGQFYPEEPSGSYWASSPSENISLSATVPSPNPSCSNCSGVTGSPITLHSIQYPVGGDYHKLAMTVSIPSYKCGQCLTVIGPFNNLTVTFTASDQYFCHSYNHEDDYGNRRLQLPSSVTTKDYGTIDFIISAIPRKNNKYIGLTHISKTEATCTTDGISQECWYCDFCKQYFANSDGSGNPLTDVERPALGHDFDTATGICKRCKHQATASLNDVFKESLAAAVTDYNNGTGGTLRAFITPEGDESFTLKKSGTLIVTSGVTLPNIILEGNPNVTIENAGTINAIKMGESSTLTINNSGTIKAIEMDKPGTLTIKNSGKMASINTPARMTGTGTRTLSITNGSSGVIDEINAPNTMITVQNDGTIGLLRGYFPSEDKDPSRDNMVTLQRGAGVYNKIHSVAPWTGDGGYAPATADFSKLLSPGDYFYLPDKETPWQRGTTIDDDDIIGAITLQKAYFTGLPIASIGVTGTADGTLLVLTPDEEKRPSMTVTVGQTVALTGGFTVPEEHGLKSAEANISYSWRYRHADSTTSVDGQSLTLKNIQYGTYEVTLTLTDNQYNYTKSLTFYLYAMQPAGQRTTIYIKGFDKENLSKFYDGTADKPANLHVVFCDADETEIKVDQSCYTEKIVYKDKNCIPDNAITATVTLTEEGAKVYKLGTHDTATLTLPAEIKQAGTSYTLSSKNDVAARVGETVFQCLELKAIWYKVSGGHIESTPALFEPATPGTDIMVEGERLSVTFYRLHPGNITNRESGSSISFIHDPSMNEELTVNSTFTAAGEYYVYAVVQPTRNFKGVEKTGCLVINVQDTETSSKHHTNYVGWDGTITATVPVAANGSNSVYLSSSLPTTYAELLLSQGKNLTLCLNGKTLSATNIFTSYNHIRVTDSAALTIEDCTGTGTVKGTAVNGGWGGIAYVKNGTITIKNGKGGAIYIKSGGTVNIYGGTIQNNHVYSGDGGAIYVEAGGTLNLYGGKITGNTASGLGGGIYVENGGTLKIQDKPVVTDNTANGKPSNVYICADSTRPLLTISGAMTSGAQLGISTDARYPALLASTQQDHSAYFTPDAPDAFVIFSGDALTLCAKPSATLEGNTLTITTGGNYKDDMVLLFVAEYSADGRLLTAQSQAVKLGTPAYTFKVQNPNAKIKCFLLNAKTYSPLMEPFTFN